MSVRRLTILRNGLRLLVAVFRATILRDTDACHHLGASFAVGDPPAPHLNAASAIKWYRRGARLGDPDCQYDLGFMLLSGEGLPPDEVGGLSWLSSAANGGSSEAMRVLIDVYALGHWGSRDPELATHWQSVLREHLESHPEDKRQYER